jgi:hypothetical protein
MKSWKQYGVYCVSGGVPRRSLVVSVVVGSILNLINQGDALFGGEPVNVAKIVLTYIVPYVVATYGAVSYQINLAKAEARGRG